MAHVHFPGGRRSRKNELPSIFLWTKKNKRRPPALRHLAQHPDPPATNNQASVEDKDFEVLDITGYVYSERSSKNNLLTPPGQTGERGHIDESNSFEILASQLAASQVET